MSRKPVALVTGAGGEVGHGLIKRITATREDPALVALDIRDPGPEIARRCTKVVIGDVQDPRALRHLSSEFEIQTVFHLAALLSTKAEFDPEHGHRVNVEGTLNLLHLAAEQSRSRGAPVRFLFPSSIAVFGIPGAETKQAAGNITEDEHLRPRTMYGCNKLYCEHLGRYYANHYRQLAADSGGPGVDFRALRFPGLISAETVPSGGTSDYGPEMIHAAARGTPYPCFVREDTRIPFMAMPDAITSFLKLMEAPRGNLTREVYNIGAFNPSAGEFAELARRSFPGASIRFEPDPRRQAIVDSWPAGVDDTRARQDWDLSPAYDLERTFQEYLVPNVRRRYT